MILPPEAADNVSLFRIALSLFAIHTTSDLMSEVMTQLARHPEVFEPLRQEVIEVLSRDGLKKTALYNLKLMDSVIKECQRIKPVTIGKQCPRIRGKNATSGSETNILTHHPSVHAAPHSQADDAIQRPDDTQGRARVG